MPLNRQEKALLVCRTHSALVTTFYLVTVWATLTDNIDSHIVNYMGMQLQAVEGASILLWQALGIVQ